MMWTSCPGDQTGSDSLPINKSHLTTFIFLNNFKNKTKKYFVKGGVCVHHRSLLHACLILLTPWSGGQGGRGCSGWWIQTCDHHQYQKQYQKQYHRSWDDLFPHVSLV